MPKLIHDGLKKRCDCAKRAWAKCGHGWHFNFHHNGREYRLALDKVARDRHAERPTSKTDAAKWRDVLRTEIRAGTFDAPAEPATPETRLTFGDVVTEYRTRYVNVPTRRDSAAALFEVHLKMLERAIVPAAHGATVALKDKAIGEITKADIEHIRATRRAELAGAAEARDGKANDPALRTVRRPGCKAGETGINRLLARLRHVFSWAIAEGYVTETPFKRGGTTVIKLEHKAETPRQRRLEPGEEGRLIEHASPLLQAVIIAALATGCRVGELLSLQWQQVRANAKGEAVELVLPAGRTKTNKGRVIPVSSRLRAVLALRRNGPDDEPLSGTAHVFGNAVGEPVTSLRAAWTDACTAAGITDLHLHDLRREFACRLLESAADLHDVRDFLGHANITTTSTYLASTTTRLAEALKRMEAEPAPDDEPDETETSPDSHSIRTNEAEDGNGRTSRPAVTH
jgi:integrase